MLLGRLSEVEFRHREGFSSFSGMHASGDSIDDAQVLSSLDSNSSYFQIEVTTKTKGRQILPLIMAYITLQ